MNKINILDLLSTFCDDTGNIDFQDLVTSLEDEWTYTNDEIAKELGVHRNTVAKIGRYLFLKGQWGSGWKTEYSLKEAIEIKKYFTKYTADYEANRLAALHTAFNSGSCK